MSPITVFQARKIITMGTGQSVATHVAVRDGRVLAVGDLERVGAWGAFTLDTRFADQVLMPGLVEGHANLTAGGLAQYSFVGFHPRPAPAGMSWPGCRSFEDVVAQLRRAEVAMTDPDAPLLAWGFDPIFFGSERMTVEHLDRVSTTRPVVILHASHHLLNVNRVALRIAGIDCDTDVEGVARFDNGEPNGELQEFAAMFPVLRVIGNGFRVAGTSEDGLRRFGELAPGRRRHDLGRSRQRPDRRRLRHARARHRRGPLPGAHRAGGHVAEPRALAGGAGRDAARPHEGQHRQAALRLVKLFADGSIQGFSARLRWPGYFNGHANGIWNQPPDQLRASIDYFHAQGFQLHIHTNGDAATEVALDAALERTPRRDHRHTLQHCQMADEAMFRRMASLGVCANLFANHLYYWGDAHRALTLGPDRAERMDACATALRLGVPLAVHSDAPITALAPMFAAWCAVNRLTSSGHVLGPNERIGVADALRAITLGAAYTLGLDDRIGSIEVGKFADFCVMDDDPTAVDPIKLKDVRITGTVLGGLPT